MNSAEKDTKGLFYKQDRTDYTTGGSGTGEKDKASRDRDRATLDRLREEHEQNRLSSGGRTPLTGGGGGGFGGREGYAAIANYATSTSSPGGVKGGGGSGGGNIGQTQYQSPSINRTTPNIGRDKEKERERESYPIGSITSPAVRYISPLKYPDPNPPVPAVGTPYSRLSSPQTQRMSSLSPTPNTVQAPGSVGDNTRFYGSSADMMPQTSNTAPLSSNTTINTNLLRVSKSSSSSNQTSGGSGTVKRSNQSAAMYR